MVADTNDALEYLRVGARLLEDDPHTAVAAFYWASRLEPNLADAFYGRRVAQLLDNPGLLQRYMEGNRRTLQSKEFRALDSLQYRALSRNPFFFRRFDRLLFDSYLKETYTRAMLREGRQPDYSQLKFWIEVELKQGDPGTRAWEAYARGRFDQAVQLYIAAIKAASKDQKYLYHADRARAFYLLGNADSAAGTMQLALENLRQQDEKRLVYFYESKAVYEHSLALTHQARGDHAAAREAYGRALQEDISYFPAHVGAAQIALATGDTAAAIAAFDLAIQIKPDDGAIRTSYGEVLNLAKRYAEAEKHLRSAIELEPYFPDPYVHLGDALLGLGRPADALTQYRAFLDHAARNDRRRGLVEQRVKSAETSATAGAR